MSIIFEYVCDTCYEETDNQKMDSFSCDCGGQYRLKTGSNVRSFTPYYNESWDRQINTPSDERKLYKEKGGGCIGDYNSIRERGKWTKRNREEIIAERYAKIGVKYPKGKNVRFDEKNHCFVPANSFGNSR